MLKITSVTLDHTQPKKTFNYSETSFVPFTNLVISESFILNHLWYSATTKGADVVSNREGGPHIVPVVGI